MTTVIGFILATYFWPTPEQVDYCWAAGWSYEIVCINNKCKLTDEAKIKAQICDVILDLKEANEILKWY